MILNQMALKRQATVLALLIIIVIAGLGSIPGILVAGLSLGIAESLGTAFIHPSFVDIYGFILLVIVLLIKPYGLFGKPERAV